MANISKTALIDLVKSPREALDIEIKSWLDLTNPNQRADLAKAIVALANHGGGYLLLGFEEHADGSFTPAEPRPSTLTPWSQDNIQDAVQKYVEPPIQCHTEHVVHPEVQLYFPIVVVPGGHRVPIKAKVGSPDNKFVKDRVYVRRPGPRSEEPQTTAEWDGLFERCIRARKEDLLAGMRDLLAGEVPRVILKEPTLPERLQSFIAAGRKRWEVLVQNLPKHSPIRFPHGFYEAGFAVDGKFEILSLDKLKTLLRDSLRNHSGWPPFVMIDRDPYRPRPVDGAIETWIGPDLDGSVDVPGHHDFWRISPDAMFYTRRGLNEDGRFKGIEPGTTFDITTPTWRVGEAILQAYYVAAALGAVDANLIASFAWKGLERRKLISTDGRRYLSPVNYTAHQNEYKADVTIPLTSMPAALPEVVHNILAPLYQLFDFFPLSKRLVEGELAEMQRHTFHS